MTTKSLTLEEIQHAAYIRSESRRLDLVFPRSYVEATPLVLASSTGG